MATNHYSLPTIVGTDTIDGVNAINGLANAVDTAIYSVAGSIPQGYVLPIATASALGGVRGGGEIVVSNSNGDMSISNGVIDSNKLAANSVGQSALQNNAVTASKLSADVSSQLSAGYGASQALAAAPMRYSMNTSTANLFGTYVTNQAAHLCTMKVSAQGATVQVTSSNTTPSNPEWYFDPIPVQYRPTTNFATIFAVATSLTGGSGLVVFWLNIRQDGTPVIYHQNYWAGTGEYTIFGEGNISWMFGVQASE